MIWRVLAAVLLNAVPIGGVLLQGWSVGTLLLLAVFDFFLATLSMGLLAMRHRRLNSAAYATPGQRPTEWFMPAFVFLVFAAAVPVAFARRFPQHESLWMPQPEGVLYGAGAIALIALAGYWFERRPVARLSLGQMVLKSEALRPAAAMLAVTILAGSIAAGHFHSPYAWLACAVLIKASTDVGRALRSPQAAPQAAADPPPPGLGPDPMQGLQSLDLRQRLDAQRRARSDPAPLPDRKPDT